MHIFSLISKEIKVLSDFKMLLPTQAYFQYFDNFYISNDLKLIYLIID